MIFNNYLAMQFIRELKGESLTPSIVLQLHKTITDQTLNNPEFAGKYRTPGDDIQIVDSRDATLLHEPPNADELPERMERLCKFANDSSLENFIHPVIRAIILHFMLAYDHPFLDGNGRTARALFYWSVVSQGYWVMEFFSISRILKQAPIQYGRAFLFTESDDNDLTYFIIHQLGVLKKANEELWRYLDKKSEEIHEAEKLLESASQLRKRLNYRQLSLLRHALKHPGGVYLIHEHQRTHGISYETARKDLLNMADKLNLLNKLKEGKAFVFVAPNNLNERIDKAKR
ncbi:MAG: Fic family protein, partial [Nitrospinota bacterium]